MNTTTLLVPVTALYGGLTSLLILYLAYRVTMYRKSNRIGMGDNGDKSLSVLIRAHANAVEYAPISLLLLLIAELNGLGSFPLHLFGGLIFASRLSHAYGFIRSQGGAHPGRVGGIAVNWLVMVSLGVIDIVLPMLHRAA